MTTTPLMLTVWMSWRIALTAAPSAPFLSPRPTQRPAAIAAASVTRTSSRARLRSGASVGGARGAGTPLASGSSSTPADAVQPGLPGAVGAPPGPGPPGLLGAGAGSDMSVMARSLVGVAGLGLDRSDGPRMPPDPSPATASRDQTGR